MTKKELYQLIENNKYTVVLVKNGLHRLNGVFNRSKDLYIGGNLILKKDICKLTLKKFDNGQISFTLNTGGAVTLTPKVQKTWDENHKADVKRTHESLIKKGIIKL